MYSYLQCKTSNCRNNAFFAQSARGDSTCTDSQSRCRIASYAQSDSLALQTLSITWRKHVSSLDISLFPLYTPSLSTHDGYSKRVEPTFPPRPRPSRAARPTRCCLQLPSEEPRSVVALSLLSLWPLLSRARLQRTFRSSVLSSPTSSSEGHLGYPGLCYHWLSSHITTTRRAHTEPTANRWIIRRRFRASSLSFDGAEAPGAVYPWLRSFAACSQVQRGAVYLMTGLAQDANYCQVASKGGYAHLLPLPPLFT